MKKTQLLFLLILFTFRISTFGQVGINTETPNINSSLDIHSQNGTKGVMLPRITTVQENTLNASLNAGDEGIAFYNTDTDCIITWNGTVFKSLCERGTAGYTVNCASSSIQGVYRRGVVTTNTEYIKLSINVTQEGPYEINGSSGNGYYFSSTGYLMTGQQDLIIPASGKPINTGANTITLKNNSTGENLCKFNTTVLSGSGNIPVTAFSSVTVQGTYIETIDMSASQSVSATGIKYTDPVGGSYGIGIRYVSGGVGNPGLTFQNQTGTLAGPQTLNMTFPATPGTIAAKSGVYTYELFDIYSDLSLTPQFTITVQAKLGAFDNPASRCTEILTQYPSSLDGYYWIKDNATTPKKYKTYCDMTNGGWTLIKSVSEKTIIMKERTQDEALNSQVARSPIITETGVFNEYQFSLDAATVSAVAGGSTWPKYVRIAIKEQGHTTATGATREQVENSTIAPINDPWVSNNYWNITMLSPLNASVQNINGSTQRNYHTSEGKLFGFPFGKASTANNIYAFNGVNFAANPPGFWNQTNFLTGLYSQLGYVASNIPANNLTYTSSNGSSVIFNKYYINDIFGIYMNSEQQLNHHIGTCTNSTDDYGGESFCDAGWANWRPHKFNNGEGRILQYWMK